MENNFKDIWNSSIDKALDSTQHEGKFKIDPVSPKEFFEVWLKSPLFPSQYQILDQVFTSDYKDWRTDLKEILLLWGEGSGKDYTTVHTLAYCAYWLCCLKSPQEYFHIGTGTPIVIACMSVNESHAKDVFFAQFTTCLKSVTNPSTGKNFFEELGVDLRDKRDIQTRKVLLPNNIQAYALDQSKYSGEGKNVLFAIFDEIAEYRYDRAKVRYQNLKNTAFSRFHDHYKIMMISYPRDEYDFMMSHYSEVEEWPEEDRVQVYRSRKAPWDVRSKEGAHPMLIQKHLYAEKEDYAPLYRKDPEDTARRYECVFPKGTGNRFIKKFELFLDRCVKYDRPSPIMWEYLDKPIDNIFITEHDLLHMQWQPWFKPAYSYEAYMLEKEIQASPNSKMLYKRLQRELQRHESAKYFIHLDLSKGAGSSTGEKDCAGLVMLHPYEMSPSQIGYYVDLAIQIRPEDEEINFEDIRKFIFKLEASGYDIEMVSMDGYQSDDFRQVLSRKGIECDNTVSVDRSRKPYDTLKGIMYQGKLDAYYYSVALRELKELQITDKGKVDHPKESQQRVKEEGLRKGSKDVADGLAGAVFSAVKAESDLGPACVDLYSTEKSSEQKLDDFMKKYRDRPE